jgi:nucleoside-diphosphate-sugar epimerase
LASKNPIRLLVLGGTGFIGRHLVRAAKLKDWDVTSVSLHFPTEQYRIDGVNYQKVDLTDIQQCFQTWREVTESGTCDCDCPYYNVIGIVKKKVTKSITLI